MATTNLGLTTINPSDYVSPTPLNENFEAIDQLGLDYVTKRGKSGIWVYRRWRSGTFECWGTFNQQSAGPNIDGTALGKFSVNYPITFAEAPLLFVSARQDGNMSNYVTYVDHGLEIAEWYVNQMLASADLWCVLYAIGRVS